MTHGGPYLYWNNRWFLCLRSYHSNFCDNSYHHCIAHRVFIFSAKKLRNIALCILFIASDFFSRFVCGEPVFSFARPSAYYCLLIHVNQYTHTYRVSLIKLANRVPQQQQCGTYRVVRCIIHYTHPVQHLNRLAIKECIALCYIRIYHTLTLTCMRMYSPENWLTWSQERSPNILCDCGFSSLLGHAHVHTARAAYIQRSYAYVFLYIYMCEWCVLCMGRQIPCPCRPSIKIFPFTHTLLAVAIVFFHSKYFPLSLSSSVFFFFKCFIYCGQDKKNIHSILVFLHDGDWISKKISTDETSLSQNQRMCLFCVYIIVDGIETQTTMIHIHSSGSYEKNKNGGEMEK